VNHVESGTSSRALTSPARRVSGSASMVSSFFAKNTSSM